MIRTATPRKIGQATVLLIAAALAAVVFVVLFGTKPAEAAFSGTNGKVAFTRSYPSGGDTEIFSVSEGGRPTQLTNNTAWDNRPSYSASGGKIAFRSGRSDSWGDIYIMNSDGTGQKRLTRYAGIDLGPVFSPTGKKIAFQSTRGGDGTELPFGDPDSEIWVMNSDGTGLKRLTNNDASDGVPSWSNDGTKIVFGSRRADPDGDIYIMNSDGSGQKRLTTNGLGESEPDLSPNGRKVVFVRDDQIYTMNAVPGSTATLLTKNLQYQDEDGEYSLVLTGFNTDPAYSPDGTRIVFSHGFFTTEGGRYTLATIDASGAKNSMGNQTIEGVIDNDSLMDDEETTPSWQPLR